MDQLTCASLSHTHYWNEVGMFKTPVIFGINIIIWVPNPAVMAKKIPEVVGRGYPMGSTVLGVLCVCTCGFIPAWTSSLKCLFVPGLLCCRTAGHTGLSPCSPLRLSPKRVGFRKKNRALPTRVRSLLPSPGAAEKNALAKSCGNRTLIIACRDQTRDCYRSLGIVFMCVHRVCTSCIIRAVVLVKLLYHFSDGKIRTLAMYRYQVTVEGEPFGHQKTRIY